MGKLVLSQLSGLNIVEIKLVARQSMEHPQPMLPSHERFTVYGSDAGTQQSLEQLHVSLHDGCMTVQQATQLSSASYNYSS